MPVIAGLSESAVRRQISDAPSLIYMPLSGRQTDANLQRELDAAASGDTSAAEPQTAPVAEVTSTGTNTVPDVVATEDEATETGLAALYFIVQNVCHLSVTISDL